jgi:hypothetical protein
MSGSGFKNYAMLHWFSGRGNDGDGGRVPGMARAHPQIFQGTVGWGRQLYIYIYMLGS